MTFRFSICSFFLDIPGSVFLYIDRGLFIKLDGGIAYEF